MTVTFQPKRKPNNVHTTVVFFVAAGYLRRYLDEQVLPKGMTRNTLVFALAALISWRAGEIVDWGQ